MTQITYNGITMKDVLTRSFEAETLRDPTDVDPLYRKITARFDTIIASGDNLGISIGSSDLGTIGRVLMERLTEPRKRFTMRIGSAKFLDVAPVATPPGEPAALVIDGQQFDIKHGPTPTFSINRIISDNSMHVTFGIVLHVPNCCSQCQIDTGTGIVNLKWWQSDSFDESFWCTRTTQGRLIVHSPEINVHELRSHCLPPLQGGFKRVSIDLTEDPSGLMLDFRIVDRQEYAAPPYPATKWSGVFSISAAGAGMVNGFAECRVTVEAGPDVPREALVKLAGKIVLSRLKTDDGQQEITSLIFDHFVISERLDRNQVDAAVRVRITTATSIFFAIPKTELGKHFPQTISDAGYNPKVFIPGGNTAGLRGLFVDALQTPCNTNAYALTNAPQVADPQAASFGEQASTEITERIAPVIETSQSNYSQAHLEAPYTQSTMRSTITVSDGALRLPASTVIGEDGVPIGEETVLIKLHSGITYRRIVVEFTRVNKPPDLPDPKTEFEGEDGIKHTLITYRVLADFSDRTVDGKTFYTNKMLILYQLAKRPNLKGGGIPYGKLPYRGTSDDIEKITALFQEDIIKF